MINAPRAPAALAWCALATVLALGIAARVLHMSDTAGRSPDEKVYTLYARQIVEQGHGATAAMFADYDRDSGFWIYPAPTRMGFVWPVAAAMKISGVRDERAGAAVAFVASVLSLLLLAWIGIRFFNLWVAVFAVLFLATSVGELGMARRAWLDTSAGSFGLLLVYLTCEIMRRPRRAILYAAFLAAGAYSLQVKESSALSYGLCGVWVVGWLLIKERSWKRAAGLALGGLLSVAACFAVWTFLAGKSDLALSVFRHMLDSRDSEWTRSAYSGPWYQFPYLLWLLGPLTAALAVVGTAVAVLPGRLLSRVEISGHLADRRCFPITVLVAWVFLSFASLGPNFQYLRIISASNGVYCLLAGLGLWYLLALARSAMPEPDFKAVLLLAVLGLAIAAVRDYRVFTSVVVRSDIRDLPASQLRQLMGR